MTFFYTIVVIILLICLIVGLLRVLIGPDNANRMLAAQLFGTIGTTIVLVFSVLQNNEVITNVALVFTLLASITVIAFLKLAEQPIDNVSPSENHKHDS
ncbi:MULTISPECIES: monovalent cation/H+ antiporter complex subunit F [unclassified Colwellia]|jgi:multicomponent Na+:H+ antiporter subunit F|uniref:monovalent cation/H+ antiporter complex subunit F n=1 Tax=unclassified Colwellia TaxID=196834 RepID=UPI0015F71B61|nr:MULTISPECIES: monovalent cation/H+ antiporter complex subunit F [unclassified Colwellia]MBA6346681.1 multiple resistance and pH regulation protein F [Colwellia sp. BRX8-9]MBA6353498.1 multiple resistance and pH regulation protein F [Colwellia sp. BRX9-1]MBA6356277.1 multiple resistance and pH regulation protein F [Colwellia sp. BRX8-3]MBA6360104.1 multiple resistance and pH regulation protein F [Colwellia sp. BRX8-6]MBA6369589.1 multiple resistance and pH regulation protein F [Colwellia sp.